MIPIYLENTIAVLLQTQCDKATPIFNKPQLNNRINWHNGIITVEYKRIDKSP